MKKIFILAILLPLFTVPVANSEGLKVKKHVKPYEVEAETNRNPLVIGNNKIEIGIKDGSGRVVTDAKVLVNYYMPPMPRMVPMNYTTKADVKGEKYRAALDVIMAGPWYIRIIINHKGSTVTTRFNMDAQ